MKRSTSDGAAAIRHRIRTPLPLGIKRPLRDRIRTSLAAVLMLAMLLPSGPATAAPVAPPASGATGTTSGNAAPGIGGTWKWPLNPVPAVTAYFDPPPQPWESGHRGVDVNVIPGQPVLSPESGRVVFAGTVVDRPVVTIDHGEGLLSSFEPASAVLAAGDTVSAGEVIATASSGGHCGTTCLHWGMRLDGEYVNPLNYVTDRRPSVLLPLAG